MTYELAFDSDEIDSLTKKKDPLTKIDHTIDSPNTKEKDKEISSWKKASEYMDTNLVSCIFILILMARGKSVQRTHFKDGLGNFRMT